MQDIFSSVALLSLTERDRRVFQRHKAQIRGLLFKIHSEWSDDWSQTDDAALDAIVAWLETMVRSNSLASESRAHPLSRPAATFEQGGARLDGPPAGCRANLQRCDQ